MVDLVPTNFSQLVYGYVEQIPPGRVMTYGQLASLSGSPRGARIVGGLAHFGPEDLPWHRVVNKQGGLAIGFPGGRQEQAEQLRLEGVEVYGDFSIDIDNLLWWPQQ
jgi:methylated-DNA-protein-cysteine methyltransferase-like protein